MARERVKERLFDLVKKVRLQRLRGLKKPPEKKAETKPSDPPPDEVAALEAMLEAE